MDSGSCHVDYESEASQGALALHPCSEATLLRKFDVFQCVAKHELVRRQVEVLSDRLAEAPLLGQVGDDPGFCGIDERPTLGTCWHDLMYLFEELQLIAET